MRILAVSNFYPPHYIGGYELGCRDVMEALKARGHQVRVLTSTHGVDGPEDDGEVFRWLETDHEWRVQGATDPRRRLWMEYRNRKAVLSACRRFKPDLVYLWNMRQISLAAAHYVKSLGLPICCFVSDDWLSTWEFDPWYRVQHEGASGPVGKARRAAIKSAALLSGLSLPEDFLDLGHVQFCSRYLKNEALRLGKPVAPAEVVHWGLDETRFRFQPETREPTRLLFVGQVVEEKGPHTAIEALRILVREKGCRPLSLTVAGGTIRPTYEAALRRRVVELGLEAHVRFTGRLDRDQVLQLYQNHDILIFPSIWNEPFSISLLEGMASGLAVVGTHTGGTDEILRDDVNGLVFPAEDAGACAVQIERLLDDEPLFQKVRHAARDVVEQNFRFVHMVDKIDGLLREIPPPGLTSPDLVTSVSIP